MEIYADMYIRVLYVYIKKHMHIKVVLYVTHAYTHTCARMYVRVYVHMYVCIHVCVNQ